MNPSSEARRLKRSGFLCLPVAITLLAVSSDRIMLSGLIARDPQQLLMAGAWAAGALLVAFGIILLLAGLMGVPLISNGRARRGALTKLAGATILVGCLGFMYLAGQGVQEEGEAVVDVTDLMWIAFVLIVRQGVILFRTGWKYDAESAQTAMARDSRPPVVYLRSFQDDKAIILASSRLKTLLTYAIGYMSAVSPEQELSLILGRVGPVVAIGKPGEPLPELGAARLYVGDDEWRATIEGLMQKARLIIIRAGNTPNLWWEVEQTMKNVPRQRILLVCLGPPAQIAGFCARFEQAFGRPQAAPLPDKGTSWKRVLYPLQNASGKIIYFGEDSTPREEAIRPEMSLAGMALGTFRPYRDSLHFAMKRVFASLGVPWVAGKSQAAAVLLAMGGGIFGLHHFYLGNRRKGVTYVATFWTGIPWVLGWIDAIRLADLDAAEFQRRYAKSAI